MRTNKKQQRENPFSGSGGWGPDIAAPYMPTKAAVRDHAIVIKDFLQLRVKFDGADKIPSQVRNNIPHRMFAIETKGDGLGLTVNLNRSKIVSRSGSTRGRFKCCLIALQLKRNVITRRDILDQAYRSQLCSLDIDKLY